MFRLFDYIFFPRKPIVDAACTDETMTAPFILYEKNHFKVIKRLLILCTWHAWHLTWSVFKSSTFSTIKKTHLEKKKIKLYYDEIGLFVIQSRTKVRPSETDSIQSQISSKTCR